MNKQTATTVADANNCFFGYNRSAKSYTVTRKEDAGKMRRAVVATVSAAALAGMSPVELDTIIKLRR